MVVACIAALAMSGCGGGKGAATRPTQPTVGAEGPLAAGLLTQTQLRQVPGLSTAKVSPLQEMTVFADPDPRGPCGGKVPGVPLRDASAVAITARTIRGGAQLVARLPAGAAKRYLDARIADANDGCPEYQTVTQQGTAQRVLLVRVVRLHSEFEQALAVVTALKVGENVRAATQIEVRRGDILSRVVIFSNSPVANVAVRGIASLVGQNLRAFDE